ncbi:MULTISPECIES: cupin domain-containing protein [unclassified Paracoccus (in: a-proteobacteria)]|uniref:cupin domain-containing protein n=1 Tax=unclassified Paracoccus (in: a-proteobacteria) TaxID=2688777 RepID=UPI0012B226F3|nr:MULTISPECIES: cupin domain-containing protein [unclassified Paracoccus (in: a-proteobacteria)]UXU74108.1 cupin domain-containing protein [Paracoccus sp. SMMA_5]UXU79997.1 cupin domain-containing protein [Paracoccus sp. SMMA_5_TC]
MSDFDVGARLKELRTAAGMSQRQLAEASGVPHGQISMIETGRSSPSVASLRKILGGMGITMAEFFEPDASQSPQPFFTPTELRDLTSRLYSTAQDTMGRITLRQVGDARLHNLQILHERYEPGADTGETMLAHHGSEGGIVIAGEIELTVGEHCRLLKAGDSYLFASNQPHRFRNLSDREAIVVSACTPPYL